jgi:hypothetical protein
LTKSHDTDEKALFAKRLYSSLQASGHAVRPAQVARDFNATFIGHAVTLHTCRKWLRGESIPTQDKLIALAQLTGVEAQWLRFGDAAKKTKINSSLAREQTLVRSFRALNAHNKRTVEALMEHLLSR